MTATHRIADPPGPGMSLLQECLAAHGGLDRWRRARAVELTLTAHGLAFASVGRRRPVTATRARVQTTGQHVELLDWPRPGVSGVFTPSGVRIGDAERPYDACGRGRRWDDLDHLAFTGAALWTYVSLPFALADWEVAELRGRRLRFRVPDGIRSHCREQTLHLDGAGRIVRHDYTANAFGSWARAANRSGAFTTRDGLILAQRRHVRPRPWGPVIVHIAFDDVAVLEPGDAAVAAVR